MVLHVLRELLIWLGPIIGVIAVGQEAEGTIEESVTAELAFSFKFTATATEKISTLGIKLGAGNGTGTSGKLALQADEGGTKPKEGVLCEGTISSVTAGEHLTTSLTAEPTVTSGTVYWLTLIPLGGTAKMKMGTTTSRAKTTVKHALISEIKTADWAAAVNKGPASIWAAGAGGEEHFTGPASVVVGAGLSSAGAKTSEAAGVLRAAGRVTATGVKATTGAAVVQAGSRVAVVGQKLAAGSASVLAGVRVAASGLKAAAGSAVVQVATRVAAVGARAFTGEGQIRAGGRIAATGVKSSQGPSSVPVAGRVAALASKSSLGAAILRVAARLLGVESILPTAPPLLYATAGDSRLLTTAGAGLTSRLVSADGGSTRLAVYAGAGVSVL